MVDLFRRRGWLVSFVFLGALAFGAGWIGSEKFLKPHRRALEPRHREAIEDPARFGFSLEGSFDVLAPDGIRLRAQLLSPTSRPGEAIKTRRMRERLGRSLELPPLGEARATVVMLHGRSGIKEDAYPVAERFVAAGLRCLVFDARAHGESGGDFTTYGNRETADLSAVIDHAEARFGREHLGPLLGFGISQGAAVLIQSLPNEPRLEAAVVVTPFSDLPAVVQQSVGNVISPKMPRLLTWGVMGLGGLRAGFWPGEIRPSESATRIRTPVMIVHGEADRVIPIGQGQEVHDAIGEPMATWRAVPEATHGNVLAVGADGLYQEMIEFWLRSLEAVEG